ncbi:MAG: M50 family metallopeptidase [Aeromicrobium sp.]|uniref:M50 family metallopeptidase n=1 Tax=Aeromicrobium sp. TaxID=1871063 RepID=UPI003C3CF667
MTLDTPGAAAMTALALVVLPFVWRYTRHVVTLVHEAGHAIVALVTGRRLNAITLHADTSGLTISSGRPTGLGMIATALAGYLAPSALGLGSLALVYADRTGWALWIAAIVLAGMLLFIRNWWGLLVVALSGAAVAAVTYRADEQVQVFAASAVAWFLLIAGPRTTLDLWGHRRRARTRTSDADVLGRLTHLPAAIWNALFIGLTVAALLAGLWIAGWVSPDDLGVG